ncbi:squalene/phytoene synthase family protein [Hyphococcus sp. DH-69]|uniref:squalene/phytoene synthase family protein n=1 Tax=Hyphococcus formosus TaxID=3143534 RepID=UPI00398AA6E9
MRQKTVMSEQRTDSATYCSTTVQSQDEDRWLACGYASGAKQRALFALYAFQIELRRIPGAVSEPALGEIRLQWWREAFDEIRSGKPVRAHPVVEEIAETGLASETYAALIDGAIDAAAYPLYGEGFADIEALEQWLMSADGAIDAMGVKILGGDQELADIAKKAGSGFALAREGRGLAPNLAEQVADRAKVIAENTRQVLAKASADVTPALLHLALTKLYAARAGKAFPIRKRLKMFSAMAFGRF